MEQTVAFHHIRHVAAQDAVCTIEPVDGAPPTAGGAGMSASANRPEAAKAARMTRNGVRNGAKTRAKRLQLRHLKKRTGSTY
jgi:hypothetical protein